MIQLMGKNPNSVIGLDIGEHTIKAVQVTKSGSQVSLDGYSSVLNDSVNLGNSISVRYKLTDLLQNPTHGKFDAKNVVISLPRQYHKTTLFSVPITKHMRTKPEKIVRNYLQLLHNDTDKMFYDFQLINNGQINESETLNTYSVDAVPREITQSIKNSLLHYGIKNVRYGSILNSTSRTNMPNGAALNFLDIGHETSRYIFVHKHVIILDDLNFGANQLINKLAKDMNIEKAHAIELLKKSGLYGSELANIARRSFEESTDNFFNEFGLLIERYNQSFVDNKPENLTITICGALTAIPGFTEFMSAKLGMNIQTIKPWQNTDIYPLKPMSSNKLALFGTAIGLSLSLD